MSPWRRLFRAAAKDTEPRPGAVDRLRARTRRPADLLRESDPPLRTGALDRLRARAPAARRRVPLLLPALVGLAAAAALAWSLRPPSPLAGELVAEMPTDRALTDLVQVAYRGAGTLGGTERAPRIRWDAGTLDVAVTPGQGIDLRVETAEATVEVVGTTFSVTRDAMGTAVSVVEGHVRVTCSGSTPLALSAGQEAACLPDRPAAWIGRALALREAGRSSSDVLAAIDGGLARAAPTEPAYGELVALRLQVLVSAGRYADALTAADAYLASGATARRAEVEALAAALRGRE